MRFSTGVIARWAQSDRQVLTRYSEPRFGKGLTVMSAVGWWVSLVRRVSFRRAWSAASIAALIAALMASSSQSSLADPPLRFSPRYSPPSYGGPVYGGPAYGVPSYGGPAYGSGLGGPSYSGPNYGGPSYGGPSYGEPDWDRPSVGGPSRPVVTYRPPLDTQRHHSAALLAAAQRLNAAICNYAHTASRSPILPAADRTWAELAERKSQRFVEGLQCRAAWGRVWGDWVALREHLKLCDRSLERLCSRGRGDQYVERAFDAVRRDWGFVEQLIERCR